MVVHPSSYIRMTKYTILNGSSPTDLTTEVNRFIELGWTPIGSHQVVVRREVKQYSGQQHMTTLNTLEYTQSLMITL